jgi:hypothetical protein
MDKEADVTETTETIGSIDTAVDGPSFGGYLTTLLSERNLTPRDLASLLELDLSLVYKWLRAKRCSRARRAPCANGPRIGLVPRRIAASSARRVHPRLTR